MSPHYPLSIIHYPQRLRRAFTLMEMMVAVSILVVIILSVGVIFKSASNAVGLSQSSLEMLSNVRGIQQQIERDVSQMDKNAFLVIRSTQFTDATVTPNVIRRGDQISFIANGTFRNRTGSTQANAAFTDTETVANSALIWWGQLAIEKPGSAWAISKTTDPTTYLNNAGNVKVQLNQVPNGRKDSDFILGRHTTLLLPQDATSTLHPTWVDPNGLSVASFPSTIISSPPLAAIDYTNITTVTSVTGETASDVTQSRIDVAQLTSSQLMSFLMQTIASSGRAANLRFEADRYCYRYGALTSPYDSDTGSLVDGYFRMHPIALQGVSSFAIEWSDGVTPFATGDIDPATGAAVDASLVGTARWYGIGLAKGATYAAGIVDPSGSAGGGSSGDLYTAIFSFDNRSQWPRSLRFRYHVADPTGRIPNGRDFVQIVKLPN